MSPNTERSQKLWKDAQAIIPGGVNSPVRAFGAVGGEPIFMQSGSGCELTDVDGNLYTDYVTSWGALILGHAEPTVIKAAKDACDKGTSFGMPTEAENLLASHITDRFENIDKIRMVSSGTEAVMSAIRLARGFTDRDLIVKFEGCYHGHSDGLLVDAGSGVATFAIPGTKGVPASYAEKTLVAPFNNTDALAALFDEFADDIACVIVEPVAGNMGVVEAGKEYLQYLRDITAKNGALLIFDEVITGFRVGPSGAQGLYGVAPDLTVLGKILGGGFPAAAYGGKQEIMDALAPTGPVYQAGTLSGNPVAMAAGLAALQSIDQDPPYEHIEKLSIALEEGFRDAAQEAGIAIQQNRVGSMQTIFFTDEPVTDYESAKRSDTERYAQFFQGMLANGVHLAPSQFEAAFVSRAHTADHIERTVAAAKKVMKEMK
jgi:glutamate-1-semialdehyde 2,1-aminomutase